MAKKKVSEPLDFGEEQLPLVELQIETFKFDLNKVTKTEIAEAVMAIISGVSGGFTDPIKEFLKAKTMSEVSEKVLESLKPFVLKEMAGEKSFKTHGLELQVTAGAKKYDYSHSDEWTKLNTEFEYASKQKKAYELLMVKAMEFANVTDDNGVIIEPAKIIGGSSEVLKTIIPK